MIRAFKVFGIDVFLHWSLGILFCLICPAIYGTALKHTGDSVESVVLSLLIGVLFVGSVLWHELAHAITGGYLGVRFSKITLFALGGAATMDSGLISARREFLISAAGPVSSLVLGGLCWAVGSVLNLGVGMGLVFGFLFSINVILGLFNGLAFMLYPSDGARLLRAAIWGATGNYALATKIAARLGQVGAAGFCVLGLVMALGVKVPWFGSGVINGLWVAVIGFFLFKLATNELKTVE